MPQRRNKTKRKQYWDRGQETRSRVKALMMDPSVKTQTQAAEILGIHKATVAVHWRAIREEVRAMREAVDQYKQRVWDAKGLDIDSRLKQYRRLISDETVPPNVQLAALQRVDDLSGVVTTKDELKVIAAQQAAESARQSAPQQPAALFVIQDGRQPTTIPAQAVDVTGQDLAKYRRIEGEQEENTDPATNVASESSDSKEKT